MGYRWSVIASATIFLGSAAFAAEPMGITVETIALRGLNKVTGSTSRVEGPVGTTLRFGNLEIIVRRCWKSEPEDKQENAALMDIMELRAGEAPRKLFLGWMFSSSPGLSGLEHPVYDMTLLACETKTVE